MTDHPIGIYIIALLSLLFSCFPSLANAARDEVVWAAATKQQAGLIKTLESLVKIESGSSDISGLLKIADFLDARLKALGFRIDRRKTTNGTGADVVVASKHGTGRKKLMLIAHMDTVYEAEVLKTQPYRRDGNKLYGPGIADDKGGIAVILHTLQIMADANWKDFATLTVLVNPDEEVGSPGSGELISELADQSDVVLSFEPTGTRNGYEWLYLGTAAYISAFLEVKGRASHAGAKPLDGRNAVLELAHQLLQTRDVDKGIPGTQLNWTNVISNKAFNQIPEVATARGDVRITIPGAESKLLEALRQKINSSHLIPDTEKNLKFMIERPGFETTKAGALIASRAQEIYNEVGRKLWLVPMIKGGTDAGYAGRSGKAAVLDAFGLTGHGYHARDEYIYIDSIIPHLYLATRLLIEIGKR